MLKPKLLLPGLVVLVGLIWAGTIFNVTGASFGTKLTAADAAAGDSFGVSVSISGDTAVAGALFDDDGGNNSGSAYVFIRSGVNWTEQAKLTPNDGTAGAQFGISIAISGDTVLVGASSDSTGGTNAGSAYVFLRNGITWTQQAKLTAADAAAGDSFGWSVDIDGDTAIVGARLDDAGAINSGSAYVFVRSGSNWTQQAMLTASDVAANDWFGVSVAISGDSAAAGAQFHDDSGSNSGSAYVFLRSGGVWSQQAKLTAGDGAPGDLFGHQVDIHGDTLLAGAPSTDDGGSDSGSAYVFVRTGAAWTQQAKLTADDAAKNDFFGSSIAVNGDRAVVGAPSDDDGGSGSGSAYVYQRDGVNWSHEEKLTAGDAAAGDQFGWDLAISGDTAVAGAQFDDDNGSSSGSAYAFVIGLDVLAADIDIKPGSDPNSVNCNNPKEVITVAILSTQDFDATSVDHSTVIFEGAGETHLIKKSGGPRRHEKDADGDGETDLVLHFRLGDSSLTCASIEATLTGVTFEGQPVEGAGNVRMVAKGGGS